MVAQVPVVVTREGSDLTVEVNGQSIKMICDTQKWSCNFAVANSGATVRVTFKPKDPKTKPKQHNLVTIR